MWPSAAALCMWLRDSAQDAIEGSSVLELGCGIGAVGVYAAGLVGAARVTLTDGGSDALLQLAQQNIEANQRAGNIPASTEACVHRVLWGDESLASLAFLGSGRWDWILGSDLTYSWKAHRALVGTLARLLRARLRRKSPRAILAHEHRGLIARSKDPYVDEQLEGFQAAVQEHGLQSKLVERKCLHTSLTEHDISLIEVYEE